MVAEHGCDTPWRGSLERISERTDEQIVDQPLLESARADIAEAEKNLVTLMASDHEDPVKDFAEELKAWADATKVFQPETGGAEGHMHSVYQESSSVGSETSTLLAGFEVVKMVRRLATQNILQRSLSWPHAYLPS